MWHQQSGHLAGLSDDTEPSSGHKQNHGTHVGELLTTHVIAHVERDFVDSEGFVEVGVVFL